MTDLLEEGERLYQENGNTIDEDLLTFRNWYMLKSDSSFKEFVV